VALVLPNCPQFLVAEFGIWKAGGIVVALNPTYSERELEQALDSTRAVMVVVLTPFYGRIKRVQGRTAVRTVIPTSIKDYLPSTLRLLFTLLKEKKEGHRITPRPGDLDVVAAARAPRPAASVPSVRTIAPSSCRAAAPRARPRAWWGCTATVAAGLQLHEWTKSAKKPWVDTVMLPLPLFHVYANVGVQPMAFVGPNPVALVPNPRDIDDLLATIKRVRPAFFNGVPTLFNAILNHPDVRAGKVDLTSIKVCFSGASALMAETKKRFEAALGSRIIGGYSLTEGMMACCVNPVKGTSKLGSIGMPISDVGFASWMPTPARRRCPRAKWADDRTGAAVQPMLEQPLETAEVLASTTARRGSPGDLGYRRGRLHLHRRSQEGSDQDERLQVAA
jgi:long-chain acyl-CoA synthetase